LQTQLTKLSRRKRKTFLKKLGSQDTLNEKALNIKKNLRAEKVAARDQDMPEKHEPFDEDLKIYG